MASGSPDSKGQWPPRSPHEALMSTPRGRQKYQRMLERTSPSPSPSKLRSRLGATGASRALSRITGSFPPEEAEDEEDEDGDEDEETLQLKLQEIQARLKLKKLQSAKAKDDISHEAHTGSRTSSERASGTDGNSRATRAVTPGDEKPNLAQLASSYVPASPVRKLQGLQDPISPRRVQLGIDKGLTAKDVSLKRVPSQKGKYLTTSRSTSQLPKNGPLSSQGGASFNDRLANARAQEAANEEKRQRIQQLRSSKFSLGKEEMEMFKSKAVDIADVGETAPTFSRQEILSQPLVGQQAWDDPFAERSLQSQPEPAKRKPVPPGDVAEDDASSFEPYSKFHLKKRILPHHVLTRQIRDMKVYGLPTLLKKVKSPDYQLPDDEQDIVIIAIVGKKSDPRAHKPVEKKSGGPANERGKFMIITLVDLKWEVDLFLFNGGFERFWKITEGTVIAILNPNIMPPPPARALSGKFSLVINSDGDTILEIGTARDLGYCQSVKKDGNLCSAWVNWKKTHFCEFHSNQALDRQRKTRVELNGSSFGQRKHNQQEWWDKQQKQKEVNSTYDRSTGTHWFASSRSAADLIDGKDRGLIDMKDKKEYMNRRLAAKEKESEMMRKLGRIGNGAGKEYMERAGSQATAVSSSQTGDAAGDVDSNSKPPDAATLGLLSKGHKIHLSPIKRKRSGGSQVSFTSGASQTAFGWGGSLKDKLAKMKEGEKLKEEEHPQRKKTRFVTEKGIKVAGRESIGMDLSSKAALNDDDDDDDELVIVR